MPLLDGFTACLSGDGKAGEASLSEIVRFMVRRTTTLTKKANIVVRVGAAGEIKELSAKYKVMTAEDSGANLKSILEATCPFVRHAKGEDGYSPRTIRCGAVFGSCGLRFYQGGRAVAESWCPASITAWTRCNPGSGR